MRDISPGHRDISRLGRTFARQYATLALARKLELVDIPLQETSDALLTCMQAHIDLNASAFPAPKQSEVRKPARSPRDRLKAYVKERDREFVGIHDISDDPSFRMAKAAGIIEKRDGKRCLLLTNPRFDNIAGGEREARQLKHKLNGIGGIRTAGGGADGARFAVKRLIGGKRRSVVAVRLSVVNAS